MLSSNVEVECLDMFFFFTINSISDFSEFSLGKVNVYIHFFHAIFTSFVLEYIIDSWLTTKI